MSSWRLSIAVSGVVGLLCGSPVHAQTSPEAETPQTQTAAPQAPAQAAPATTPRLPVLLSASPATYPAAALAKGEEASVGLILDISASGEVIEVEIKTSAGPEFDAAARLAARGFRFSPAIGADGEPAAARIEYVYRFSPTQMAPVSVEGRIREAGVRVNVEGASIAATGPDGQRVYGESQADGTFRISGLSDGQWELVFAAPSLVKKSVKLTVVQGKVQTVQVYLVRDEVRSDVRADEEIEITAVRSGAEIAERTLTKEEIRYLPGTNGDVVRVVQNLPGVARAPLGTGQLRIRGTAPEDSLYFLDGARIPIVFHFSGLSTVVSSDLLEEVGYFPGNYSVRYGRALGGLVDLRTRNEIPERSNGHVAVDVYQATTFVEQIINSRNAVTFSGRRSYADVVLNPILTKAGLKVQAPRYYDFQARWSNKAESGAWTDVMFLLSDDRFRFLGGSDDEDDVQVGFATTFQKLRMQHLRDLSDDWKLETSVLAGPENVFFEYEGASEAYEQSEQFSLRAEVRREVSETQNIGLRFGADPMVSNEDFVYDIARPPEKTVGGGRFAPREDGSALIVMPGVYGELEARMGPVTIGPGVRVDGYLSDADVTMWSADPRLTARWVVSQFTALKAGTGRHTQFPTLRQLLPGSDGNPDLTPEWAIQSSVGIEQLLVEGLKLDMTAFHYSLRDLVSGREDRFRFYSGPPPAGPFDTGAYANDGTGQVYGLEGLLRLDMDNTLALISATLSRSERVDRPGEDVQLFEYDQPLVINALATQELPRRWRLGARIRYGSGNPYTPVVNRVYDMERREFVPIYGDRDSGRLPAFFSLDLRIDKDYVFKNWTLTTYLDIQNATYAKNIEVLNYTYDYTEEDPVLSSPPLPAFGLRGEW